MVPAFGEADSARLALAAALQHFHVALEPGHGLRTSPLYVHVLKRMMDHGMRLNDVPRFMNWATLVSCGVALVAGYGLFRTLVNRFTAALACCLLAVTPAFWMGANYGMAHTVALALLLLAYFAFSTALDEGIGRRSAGLRMALAAAFLTLAYCFKADFILTGLSFPTLAWLRRRPLRYFGVAGCAVVAVALGLQLLYVKLLPFTFARPNPTTVDFAKRWHEKFPFDTDAFLDKRVFGSITHSTGPFLFAITLLAIAAHLLSREELRLGTWAAASSLPVMAFWGMIFGNSVRHNLSALPPLMLLVASLVVRVTESRFRAATLAVLILGANYYSDTKGSGAGSAGILPRTDLIELSRDQQTYSKEAADWANAFAALDSDKKGAVARDVIAETQFAVLARAERRFKFGTTENDDLTLIRGGKVVQYLRFVYCSNALESYKAVRELHSQGYVVRHRDC